MEEQIVTSVTCATCYTPFEVVTAFGIAIVAAILFLVAISATS